MPVNVIVSIQFPADTEQEANDIINAFVLPPGSTVSSQATAILEESSGIVDDEGNIQPPDLGVVGPPSEEQPPTNGAPVTEEPPA